MARLIVLALIGLVLAAAPAEAQDRTPTGSPERGRTLFVDLGCFACHGTHGQGGERGAGPRIYPNPFPWPVFLQMVRTPRRDMPPYIDKWVSDQDVADVYAYLLTVKPAPAAKDIPLLNP